MQINKLAPQRLHTQYFLRYARSVSPVFLDTEVNMESLLQHRAEAHSRGQHYSIVSYAIFAGARVLSRWPQANSAIGRGLRPSVARYASVDAKLALDKTYQGQRIVASVPLPNLQTASLESIQTQVNHYRDTPFEQLPEMRGIRLLHRLPSWLGWLLFSTQVSKLKNRPRYMGTFAVSSLGHRPVNGFHAVGGGAITLNLGQVKPSPLIRDGVISIGQLLRLNMSFDHRLLDGADAADILTEIKEILEQGNFT